MSERDFDEDEWGDEESVDEADTEVDDPDDESTFAGKAEMTVADIEFDDSHEVVRTNRTLSMDFRVRVKFEVIEPPRVFDAEIQQMFKRLVRSAITDTPHRLGTVVGFDVETFKPEPEED